MNHCEWWWCNDRAGSVCLTGSERLSAGWLDSEDDWFWVASMYLQESWDRERRRHFYGGAGALLMRHQLLSVRLRRTPANCSTLKSMIVGQG